MNLAAKALTIDAHAFTDRLHSLGLFRNGVPRLLATAGLAFIGLSALKKASGVFSQARLNNYTQDTYNWTREVVVVTGGSGGLGAPLVRKFAEQGATVISLDIAPPTGPLPENAYFYEIDLTNTSNIKEVAARIRRDHGDPTVLVNNAGVAEILCLLEESEEAILRTFNINIISHFVLVKEFLPAMVRRNHGHIVTIASMRSFVASARGADYSCSKAAALAFHESVAQEVRHHYNAPKVRTSIVHPSFIRTPIISKIIDYAEARYTILDPEDVSDGIFKHILSGNSGQLFFPKSMSSISLVRGLPTWVQEVLRDSQFKGIVPYYTRNTI